MVGTFLFAASLVACGMPGHGRVVSKAVLVAVGVTTEGRRELLGYDVVASETEDSWLRKHRWQKYSLINCATMPLFVIFGFMARR